MTSVFLSVAAMFRSMRPLVLLVVSLFLLGCDLQSARREQEAVLARLPRRVETTPSLESAITNSRVSLVQTDLSPFLLFHSSATTLRLFVPSAGATSAPPHYLAYGANGPKILTNGMSRAITNMQERWILTWFQGGQGWEKSDCPIGIQLQHSPTHITLDAQGLRLEFGRSVGYWGMMAMYGAQPLPTSVAEAAAQGILHAEFKKLPKVWEWSTAVTRDPLTRLRYWGSAFARFPYQAWRFAELSTEGGRDAYAVHAQFDWLVIPCDWEVTPWTQAPISTALAQSSLHSPSSTRVSPVAYDMQLRTSVGPLFSVGDSLSYSTHVTGLSGLPVTARRSITGDDSVPPTEMKSWQPWRFVDSGNTTPMSSLRVMEGEMRLEWIAVQGDQARWVSLGEMDLGQDRNSPVEARSFNANTRIQSWK